MNHVIGKTIYVKNQTDQIKQLITLKKGQYESSHSNYYGNLVSSEFANKAKLKGSLNSRKSGPQSGRARDERRVSYNFSDQLQRSNFQQNHLRIPVVGPQSVRTNSIGESSDHDAYNSASKQFNTSKGIKIKKGLETFEQYVSRSPESSNFVKKDQNFITIDKVSSSVESDLNQKDVYRLTDRARNQLNLATQLASQRLTTCVDPDKTYLLNDGPLPDYKKLSKPLSNLALHNKFKFTKASDVNNNRLTPELKIGATLANNLTRTSWCKSQRDLTDTSKFKTFVDSFHVERQGVDTLKKFLVDCVLNDGHLSKSNQSEITQEQLKSAGRDKFYIPPRKDNIILSEQPEKDSDKEFSSQKKDKIRKVQRVIEMRIEERDLYQQRIQSLQDSSRQYKISRQQTQQSSLTSSEKKIGKPNVSVIKQAYFAGISTDTKFSKQQNNTSSRNYYTSRTEIDDRTTSYKSSRNLPPQKVLQTYNSGYFLPPTSSRVYTSRLPLRHAI